MAQRFLQPASSLHRFLRPLRRLGRSALVAAVSASLLGFATSAAHAGAVRIELEDAPPSEIARQLQHVLGAPVEIRGGEGKRLTLQLATLSPERILDRVTTQLGGTWRMRLLVRPGRPETPRVSPVIDHSMVLGVQDVPAQRAVALVARELKAELEVQGDLSRRVSLIAANVPASVVLDRIAEQAGITWDVAYRLDVPDAPAPVPVAPRPREMPELLPAAPMPPPVVLPVPTGPSAAALRSELWAGINRIVRAAPDQRAAVVHEFVQRGEVILGGLARLSPAERAERLRVLGSVVVSWTRLYQGLAPTVRSELAPVTALLERLRP